jgi:hypothetical protein
MNEPLCPECEAVNVHEPWCSQYVHEPPTEEPPRRFSTLRKEARCPVSKFDREFFGG